MAKATDRLRPGADLIHHPLGLAAIGVVYLLLGWLFGSYTVLRWQRLELWLLLQRLLLTAAGTALVMVVVGWVAGSLEEFTLVHRGTVVILLSLQSVWSFGLRRVLRAIGAAPGTAPPQLVMVSKQQSEQIRREWQRTPHANSLHLRELAAVPALTRERLEQLAEQHLERLPPALLPEDWLEYSQLPWSNTLSFQRQLKRVADVVVSLTLLLVATPLLVIVAMLIYLDDGGPVFYFQERSGWLGETFIVIKLRTMQHQVAEGPAKWTVPGDRRITRVGRMLRPMRLDELPQLLNVLRGEMSLIGPRPERPSLEFQLEQCIPHYRKRHWMPPGLSGWAQVSAPYAGSMEEAELKLSYDLYYLRYWSTALDLLILVKTIKTVLKGAGR